MPPWMRVSSRPRMKSASSSAREAMEDVETNERNFVWGTKPNGIIVLTSTGRWVVVQTAEGRRPPHTDEERALAVLSCATSRPLLWSCHRGDAQPHRLAVAILQYWFCGRAHRDPAKSYVAKPINSIARFLRYSSSPLASTP